jgi:peptide/nickel transport system permease protein
MPSARIAIVILAAVAFLAAFGSTLAPQNPLAVNANALFQGPGLHHLLGTDYLGRDVLSRLMAGTRLSVLTALEAVGIGLAGGAVPGIATVFLGRWFDFVANRVADALMTLPYVFFAVAVTAALGNDLGHAMIAVGILLIPAFFRITRAAALEHARAQYVEAAELLGASKVHIIRVHVLRKVLPNVVVTTASMTAAALLAVSFHLPRHRRAASGPDVGRGPVVGPRLPLPGTVGAVHPRTAHRGRRRLAERAGRRLPRPEQRGDAGRGQRGEPQPGRHQPSPPIRPDPGARRW